MEKPQKLDNQLQVPETGSKINVLGNFCKYLGAQVTTSPLCFIFIHHETSTKRTDFSPSCEALKKSGRPEGRHRKRKKKGSGGHGRATAPQPKKARHSEGDWDDEGSGREEFVPTDCWIWRLRWGVSQKAPAFGNRDWACDAFIITTGWGFNMSLRCGGGCF